MKNLVLFFVIPVCFIAFSSSAQVGKRWYSYGEYLSNETTVGYDGMSLWNDTTALFGYLSAGTPTYYMNTFTSIGMGFAPVLPAWNDVPLYGSTIKVGPGDAFTIDSVRIYGGYYRNNAKPLPKDTLRLSFVYGNGSTTTNLPEAGVTGLSAIYGYDPLFFPDMAYDSISNIAGRLSGVATLPYVQSIILAVADTASDFSRAVALTTPFAVPAGNLAAMSLTFKSGDATYTPFDTVAYASGTYKYGTFIPLLEFAGATGSPSFPPYSLIDSNVGYFKNGPISDAAGWAGFYIPNWAWTTGGIGASELQYPLVDFHINCPTCDLSDSIAGTASVCAGSTSALSFSLSGGTWSSSGTGIATVGLTTGVVYGVSAGVVTITYTLSGHHAYASFTVDAAAPITGVTHVCTGSTTVLSDVIPVGTWSSGSAGVATVDLIGGTVHGVAPGTAVITYTLASGCVATTIVTVYASPAPITGVRNVCIALTTALADATGGGTWSSGTSGVATVGLSTGVVTGVTPGTTTITYTVGTCTATAIITVNTTPVAGTITGASTVCPGVTILLSDGIPGGVWSSGATGTATVNSSGVVTGVAAGSATISYSVTNSCGTVFTTAPVTVSPAPDAGIITASVDSVCQGYTVTFVDLAAAGTWSSSNPAVSTVTAGGIVTGVAAGVDNISYSVTNSCGTANATLPVTVFSTIECELNTNLIAGSALTELKIFPNPNEGTFAMNLLSGNSEQAHIIITNIVGETVKEFSTTTNKMTDIKLSEGAGIYFLSATTSSGKYVAKIMVE